MKTRIYFTAGFWYLLIVFIVLFFAGEMVFSGEKNVPPQKFKVTYKITYNEITLERAAELEQLIKQRYGDACEIDIAVEKIDNSITIRVGSDALWFADSVETYRLPTWSVDTLVGIKPFK